MKTSDVIRDLRALADWLEQHPDLPPNKYGISGDVRFILFLQDKTALASAARWLGDCEKRVVGEWFSLLKSFGCISIDATIERPLVCERIKTGERVVPAMPERVLPATEEKVEEIFTWKCPDSILREEATDLQPV